MKHRVPEERLAELISLHELAGSPPTELGKILYDLQEASKEIFDLSAALDIAKAGIKQRNILLRILRTELAELCARMTTEVRERVRSLMREVY